MEIRLVIPAVLALLLAASHAHAQQSASYRLNASAFNQGGDPRQGIVLASPGYRITLDAIGGWGGLSVPASASYSLQGGFVGAFGPPGEIRNLRFTGPTTLIWDPDPTVGDYALYRGGVGQPFDGGYGICQQPPPALLSETAAATANPAAGSAHFFLVTARNRLGEEGTKGFTSAGGSRSNPAPCP